MQNTLRFKQVRFAWNKSRGKTCFKKMHVFFVVFFRSHLFNYGGRGVLDVSLALRNSKLSVVENYHYFNFLYLVLWTWRSSSYITGTISKNLIGKIRAITMMNIGYMMKRNLCLQKSSFGFGTWCHTWYYREARRKGILFIYLFLCIYFDNEALISVKPFIFTFIWTVCGIKTKTRASDMRSCKQKSATRLQVCF